MKATKNKLNATTFKCQSTLRDTIRFSDFGTMLEIRGIQYFDDGRSVLDTVGGRRFRVVDRDTRDGYQVANVEFLEDATPLDSDVRELQVYQ